MLTVQRYAKYAKQYTTGRVDRKSVKAYLRGVVRRFDRVRVSV